MPLSLPAEYLYFLMVTFLWASPIAVAILIIAWRRKRLWVTTRGLVIALPILALLLQLGFRAEFFVESQLFTGAETRIDEYLGDPQRSDILLGGLVGTVRVSGVDFRRYRFPSLDGDPARQLEIRVPPEGITTAGWVEQVRADDSLPVLAPARLVLKPRSATLNPAMATDEYFNHHHGGTDPMAYGPHTIILSMRARDSAIIHPRGPGKDNSWQWTQVVLDID